MVIHASTVPGQLVPCPFGATASCKLLHSIQLGEGPMGTVLAEPYAALRTGRHSWVLLPHNSVRGQQIHRASRTRTHTCTLLQHMVLGIGSLRPAGQIHLQGRLSTGHPAACTYTTQQRLQTPTASLMRQHPKPIARIARVAQLAFSKLLVGAFQFSDWLALPVTPVLPAPTLVDD